MSKRIQQGFMKIMPTSLIAILVTGLFLFTAVQYQSVTPVYAVAGEGTATIGGGANQNVEISTSNVHSIVLTVGATGIDLTADDPTFTLPAGFTAPHAAGGASVPTQVSEVDVDGEWFVAGAGVSCAVAMGTSGAVGQTITADISGACATTDTITLTYKGTAPATANAAAAIVITTDDTGAGGSAAIGSPPTLTVYGTSVFANHAVAAVTTTNNLVGTDLVGGTDLVLGGFSIAAAGENVSLTSIRIVVTPTTMVIGELSNLRIVEDDGTGGVANDGVLDAGELAAPLATVASPVSGNNDIAVVDTVNSGTTDNYFIVGTLAATVSHGDTLDVDADGTATATGVTSSASITSTGASTNSTRTVTDTTPPTVVNTYSVDTDADGNVDALDVEFSEAILDASVTLAQLELDNDATNNATGEQVATGGSTTVVYPGADATANDKYYRLTLTDGAEIAGTEAVYLHITGTSLTDANGVAIVAADNVGTPNDRAAPVFSATAPATSAYTNAQQVSYTVSEALTGGTITWTKTGGVPADAGSPHTCALQGTALTSGTHTDLVMATDANACATWASALVDGVVYAVTFDGGDGTQPATQVSNTGVTYDTTAPGFLAVTSLTWDTNADGTIDMLRVDFNEQINLTDASGADGISSLALSDGCTIAPGDYTNLGATTISLAVTGCTAGNTGITPTVTYTSVGSCGNHAICDVAGNEMANAANVVLTDDAAPVPLSAKYEDPSGDGMVDRIAITFSADTGLACTYEAGDWTINNPGTVNVVKAGCGVTGNVVNFGVTADAAKTGGAVNPTFSYANAGTLDQLKDGANNPVAAFGPFTATDGANPVRTGFIAYEDIGGDGSVDQVSMYFTEQVSYTYQDSDWTAVANELTNFDVTGCTSCTNVSTMTFTATTNANLTGVTTTEPTLAYTAGNTIADAAANTAANFGAVSLTDAASPHVISGTYQDNNGDGKIETIVLVFTEDTAFNMVGANWTWGVAGDMTFAGAFAAAECTGTGTDTITCVDAGTGTFDADAGETGATTQPRWDYDGAGGVGDGANGMASKQITLLDGAAPAFVSATAVSDTNIQINMSEAVSVNFGAAADWSATGMTATNVAWGAGALDLTVAPLNNTGFTANDFAFAITGGSFIRDAALNATAAFSGKTIADAQAPVLVGAAPVTALKQDGLEPTGETNLWYYYAGDSLELSVIASEPLTVARACVQSITGDSNALTCDATEFTTGVLNTDFISTNTTPGLNEYVFDTALAALAGLPSTVDGFPMNIALQDANGNWGFGGGGAQAYTAVFNVVPTTIDATLGGTTTDWSTITDFTAATGLVFEKTGGGILSFAGALDLTATATVNALQALSTNVITAVDNPTGTAVLGIRSDNLAAFDTAATLTAHMPSAVRPGVIVYDNTGAQIGQVPNDQSGDIVVGGDTLGTFTWNAGAQTLSWTTTGFSSFGTDSTPPTVTAGNIQLTSTGSGTAGAYIIGDQVVVEWDNSAAGDNNGADFDSATANFTGFGGGAAVAMTDTIACGGTAGDDIYEACYTIIAGAVDGININAAVTAYDLVGNPMTASGTDNATVDNIAPVIGTPGSLSLTSDVNTNTVANIGDTVTYNNAVPGAADTDTFTVDLTALTGDAAATNALSPYTVILGTLTGTQTFTETVTDNAGNTATGSTTGRAVDNRSLLSSTDVQPASLVQSTTGTATVAFTTATNLPANGKIKVTFGAGFDVTGAANGTCSTMDGTFVTTVAGQIVTITRQNDGAIEAPGAQTCTIDTIVNPVATGSTGTYTITTTTSVDAGIDIDDAVTADTIASATVITQCNDGIDNDGNGLIDLNDSYCTSAADTLEAYEGGGGGGGGGGASTSTTSNSTTTTAVAPITTLEGDQTYSSPVQFDQADITVDEDNGTSTAQLTDEGSLTMKPNSKSTISAYFPPNTEVTGPANWNGRIDPPVVRSLTMITRSGEKIEGTSDKLMRDDVAAIIKVGATVPLQFSQEVTLEIPVDLPNGSVILLYTSQDGNTWEVSGEGVVQDGKLVVKTDHFSYFAVAMTDETKTAAEMAVMTQAQNRFGDIIGHWAEAYINEIANLGIVSGKTATTYAPNDYITRAELAKIATKAFGIEIDPTPGLSPFSDVPLSAWFTPYIVAARNAGIVQGYENNVFSPNGLVNRAEALKIILESAGFGETSATSDFDDVPSDAWFNGYVSFASQNGVVSGYGNGKFGPGNSITRAEVAKIVIKVMELQE